jgi:hypothetical protein
MRLERVRGIASAAAVGSAILYFSIGFGFVSVGSTIDLLGACLGIGLLLLVASVVVMDVRNRLLLAGFALVVVALIVGYVFEAPTRIPTFETWGLLLQAIQVVLLVALARLVFAPPPERDHDRPPIDVLTWKGSSA